MTHPRTTLAAVAASVVVAMSAACTPSTTATVIPTVASSSPTPSSTPSATYGPNQTAAIAAVTGYYAWWNRARKNPRDPQFKELPKYVDVAAKLSGSVTGDVVDLVYPGFHQVGDMVITSLLPGPESPSQIGMTICLDRTGTSVVNEAGVTVDPIDGRTGATIPASQVFTRRTYFLTTQLKSSNWVITDLSGGTSPC
jgi:hypothetical protein